MSDVILPNAFRTSADLMLLLLEAAVQGVRKAARTGRRVETRRRRGQTLEPGPGTPLWNELVKQALPELHKRGSQAQLARLLGVSRQRVHGCLKSRKACLDAERTLLLLCWVAKRQQGSNLMA